MGNVFGQPQAAIQWNIPPVNNQNNQNNLNRAHRSQMGDMVLHFGFPLMCIAFLVYQRHKTQEEYRDQLRSLSEETLELLWEKNQSKLEFWKKKSASSQESETQTKIPSSTDVGTQTLPQTPMKDVIEATKNYVEEHYISNQRKELRLYEDVIEEILDIRCSLFKNRQERIVLQDRLINRLPNSSLNGVISYVDLKEIFDNDWKFRGSSRQTNGKLRFLYAQNWALQLELQKFRILVEALKNVER